MGSIPINKTNVGANQKISFCFKLKISKTFSDVSGIIGLSRIETFLIISKETYTMVFSLVLSSFFAQGLSSLKYL